MNQTQVRYARERAKDIFTRRRDALRDKHTTQPVRLSSNDKLKALKSGEFTIIPSTQRNRYDNWSNSVVFNGEVNGGLNADAYNREYVKLEAEFTKLNDTLVLGDNEEALRLLEVFDK